MEKSGDCPPAPSAPEAVMVEAQCVQSVNGNQSGCIVVEAYAVQESTQGSSSGMNQQHTFSTTTGISGTPPSARTGWMESLKVKENQGMLKSMFASLRFTKRWIVLRTGTLYVYGAPSPSVDLGFDLLEEYKLEGCKMERVESRIEISVADTGTPMLHLKSCEIAFKEGDLQQWEQSIMEHIAYHITGK